MAGRGGMYDGYYGDGQEVTPYHDDFRPQQNAHVIDYYSWELRHRQIIFKDPRGIIADTIS